MMPELSVQETPTSEGSGKRARLTERDRQILAALTAARYLSMEQVGELFFAGCDASAVRRRLAILSGARARGLRFPYVERIDHRDYDGSPVTIWTPSERGYLIGSEVLGEVRRAPTTPKVGANFVDHVLCTNSLFVALFASGKGGQTTVCRAGIRWLPVDMVRLPMLHFEVSAQQNKARTIIPDATVELLRTKRRVFIEFESGAHPLADPSRRDSTQDKLTRYEAFLHGLADPATKQTWYRKTFADELQPEVIIVTATERRENTNALIARWRQAAHARAKIRALTLADATLELRPLIDSAPAAVAQPAAPSLSISAADIEVLATFRREAVAIIKGVRHAIREGRAVEEPSYPGSHEAFSALLQRLGARK